MKAVAMLPLLLCASLVACQRPAQPPGAATPAAPPPAATRAAAAPARVIPQDVSERDPRYMIGISYPPGIDRYPGLAQALQGYAQSARSELMQALAGLGEDKPTVPYDLSLAFTVLAQTPQLVVVAADGSSYTGGAHGMPLLERFVWLPQQDQRLTAAMLVPDAAGWREIAAYVREKLHAELSQRIDADDLSPGERAQLLRDGIEMIDAGTAPRADNFACFEPVLDAAGRIGALRFVFPPYQVGPYSDGVQRVEVPAAIVLPHVAPRWRSLFAGQ